jgi:hypothetical protein
MMALSEHNSGSYIQPDDGYICIAETCGCVTCMIKVVCIDCYPFLYVCVPEQNVAVLSTKVYNTNLLKA